MWAQFERFQIQMTLNQAKSVSHPGDCLPDVKILVEELRGQLNKLDPKNISSELQEYGAWDEEELSDTESNFQRIVWIAGCNIIEELKSKKSKRLKY